MSDKFTPTGPAVVCFGKSPEPSMTDRERNVFIKSRQIGYRSLSNAYAEAAFGKMNGDTMSERKPIQSEFGRLYSESCHSVYTGDKADLEAIGYRTGSKIDHVAFIDRVWDDVEPWWGCKITRGPKPMDAYSQMMGFPEPVLIDKSEMMFSPDNMILDSREVMIQRIIGWMGVPIPEGMTPVVSIDIDVPMSRFAFQLTWRPRAIDILESSENLAAKAMDDAMTSALGLPNAIGNELTGFESPAKDDEDGLTWRQKPALF